MNDKKKAPGDQPGAKTQCPSKGIEIMNTVPAMTDVVTADEHRAWALATRTWMEQQVTTPAALAALAAAETHHGIELSEHPLDRLAHLDILIRTGQAPDVDPANLALPPFTARPAWAIESTVKPSGGGSVIVEHRGRTYGDEVHVRVEQWVEIVLWPDLEDDDTEVPIGHASGDEPRLYWNTTAAEKIAQASPGAATRFATALAEAAQELTDIRAHSLTRHQRHPEVSNTVRGDQ